MQDIDIEVDAYLNWIASRNLEHVHTHDIS